MNDIQKVIDRRLWEMENTHMLSYVPPGLEVGDVFSIADKHGSEMKLYVLTRKEGDCVPFVPDHHRWETE